jgi:hypothetical protein
LNTKKYILMAASTPSSVSFIGAGGKNSTIACARSTAAGRNYSDGLSIVDAATGEFTLTQLFVAVWGASNYTYAEATMSQTLDLTP